MLRKVGYFGVIEALLQVIDQVANLVSTSWQTQPFAYLTLGLAILWVMVATDPKFFPPKSRTLTDGDAEGSNQTLVETFTDAAIAWRHLDAHVKSERRRYLKETEHLTQDDDER